MSVGLQLLRAVIDQRSRTTIRELQPELFTDEERPIYDFVMSHYRQYGGLPSLDALAQNGFRLIPAQDSVAYYLHRVRNRAVGNVLQANHPEFVRAMGQGNSEAALETLRTMLASSTPFSAGSQVVPIVDAAESVITDYELAASNPGMRGLTTGWDFLDDKTAGMANGDVWVVAARPGMGKSYLLLNMALNSWRAGASVLFVSMEMTVLQTARRFLAMHAGINPSLIRRGQLDMYLEQHFYEVLRGVGNMPPFWMVSGDLSQSTATVDAMVQEFNPDLVVVDAGYLLKATMTNSRFAKHEVMQEVLRELKAQALSRNRPYLLSFQFNREGRKGKGDIDTLAGSDWIGQIASVIIGLREGPAGSERSMRIAKCHKNREDGGEFEWAYHYLFQPFDMSFAYELRPDGSRADEERPMDSLASSMGHTTALDEGPAV